MAGYPEASLNAALDGIKARGAWISLHTGDPGITGANELTGGSPAYARLQTTWGTAASGVVSGSAQTLNIPAAKTINYFGVWTASTGGSFVGGGPLRNAGNTQNISEQFTEQGTYSITPRLTADNIVV